uniref:Copia protein n=1 Tax=Cajanus cajan TaxID=3821 RepID=A0A151U0L5_CAJCA|nr:Copia protein [Cajanus cajan]
MTDLGMMRYFLGMEVHQFDDGIFLSQKKYANDLLKKFKLENCNPVSTPLAVNEKLSKADGDAKADVTQYRSLVGSLLYLTATRPDLMFCSSLLSRFMHSPSLTHFGVGKRVLRYLKGYVFSLGSGVFSWNSKKQDVVAQSSAEAEYVAAAAASNQAIWVRKVLTDLSHVQMEPTVLWCDNKSAISIAKNPIQHGRTKHINVKFHAIREAEKNGDVQLMYCRSEEQLADILTKALPSAKFNELRSKLGVLKKSFKEEC